MGELESRSRLFLASNRTLYLIAKTGLYQLSEQADTWTLTYPSDSNQELAPVMAERSNTLYLLTSDELLASTDRGSTWDTLDDRPNGRAIALIIREAPEKPNSQNEDMTMYLILQTLEKC